MRRPHYAPAALASLDSIADWTADTFGPVQARLYLTMLRDTCNRIAEGKAASRSVRDALASGAPPDLRFVKAGSHYVLFRERDGRVEITDVLHEAMDVAGRLER